MGYRCDRSFSRRGCGCHRCHGCGCRGCRNDWFSDYRCRSNRCCRRGSSRYWLRDDRWGSRDHRGRVRYNHRVRYRCGVRDHYRGRSRGCNGLNLRRVHYENCVRAGRYRIRRGRNCSGANFCVSRDGAQREDERSCKSESCKCFYFQCVPPFEVCTGAVLLTFLVYTLCPRSTRVPPLGLEPRTHGLKVRCSRPTEL